MKMKAIINGEHFEIVKGDVIHKNCYRSLSDCYNRCSQTKHAIFDFWYKWFMKANDCSFFGVASYNCMMFTLSGIIYDAIITQNVNADIGIYITPAHNYMIIDENTYNYLKVLSKKGVDTIKVIC